MITRIGKAACRSARHRDLAPVQRSVADTGMVKVADLGTSRFRDRGARHTVIGSSPCGPLEQLFKARPFASDIYSPA
jgi:hypothetical protein